MIAFWFGAAALLASVGQARRATGTYLQGLFHQTATNATLLARVAGGNDSGAWGEFCTRYGQLIRAFCLRRGLQAADVDDVQQDVLLSLNSALPGFTYDPAKGRFRSYLKTVVVHAIYRRSFQKRGPITLPDVEAATRLGDADASTEEAWEAEWRQYHLRQAMMIVEQEFNATDLAAFERTAALGHGPAEVAADLGVSVDSVYQAKSRIIKRLGALIAQQVEDEG